MASSSSSSSLQHTFTNAVTRMSGSSTTTGKPDRTTMEGMIWNAHHVLEQALDPEKSKGIPKVLFDKCIAVVLLSVVEGGFVFSGNVGTGIILKKTSKETTTTASTSSSSSTSTSSTSSGWSLPVACGLVGVGWGFMAGVSLKDIIVFVMDEFTLESMLSEKGFKLGGQAELTLGMYGRSAKLDVNAGKRGFGSTVSFAFSKGLFGGISFEGAVVGIRNDCNANFYNQNVIPKEILSGSVPLPSSTGNGTLLQDVYTKLNQLALLAATAEASGSSDYTI